MTGGVVARVARASLCADPGGQPECSEGYRDLKEHQYKL